MFATKITTFLKFKYLNKREANLVNARDSKIIETKKC